MVSEAVARPCCTASRLRPRSSREYIWASLLTASIDIYLAVGTEGSGFYP
jgi:hypothetical protein